MEVTHLFADVLPLAVELVQLLLDVDGVRRLGLFLQVQAHLVDAVDAGLDGVDVIHQSLANGNAGRRLHRWNSDCVYFSGSLWSLGFFSDFIFFTSSHENCVYLLIFNFLSVSLRDILWTHVHFMNS